MANLHKKIEEWRLAGLISGEQEQALLAHEAERTTPWFWYSLLALAVSTIGIGIISLVAANWSEIADGVKLGADYLLLALLAGMAWRKRDTSPVLFETLLALFLFACLASIGLIAQIYHTGGRPEEAFLFWCLVTLPAVSLSQRAFLPHLWSVALIWSLIFYLGAGPWWDSRGEENWMAVFFSAPPLILLTARLLAWREEAAAFSRAFYAQFITTGLVSLAAADIALSFDPHTLPPFTAFLPGVIALGVLALTGERDRPLRRRLTAIIGLFYAVFYLAALPARWDHDFTGPLFVIPIVLLAAAVAGIDGRRRLANGLILLAGLRFLVVYFQALGGLALTGFGLIGSGLFILWLLSLWHRNRERITRFLEELE